MLISELIKKLEGVKEDYGDIPVNAEHSEPRIYKDVVLCVRSQPYIDKADLRIIGFKEDEVDKPE